MAEPFPKSSQLARGERRYRRKVASPKQWAAIRAEKLDGQPCRICDDVRKGAYELTRSLHHLVPRSMGGDDVADNLVATHNVCHDAVHRRDPVALQNVALTLTDGEYAYVVGKLGEGAMGRLFGV